MKIGTKTADKVEELGRTSLRKLQEWSKEDPNTRTDDALRLLGGGLKNVGRVASLPGIKQGLQLADAPFHYLAKGAGKAAGAAGIDPRWGEWLVRTGELATGVGVGKKALKKTGKLAQASADDIASLMMRQNPMFAGSGGGGLGGPGGNLKKQFGVAKRLEPVDGVYNLTKTDMPQIKRQLAEWLDEQYKAKGSSAKIKRKEFGTIIIDDEPRAIQGLTEYLDRQGNLPSLPKIATRKQANFSRLQRTKPPYKELNKYGKELGLSKKEINQYIQEAQDGFADVQTASRRQGLTLKQITKEFHTGKKTPRSEYNPGQYHAGHFWPAAKGGATSKRTAGIEPGKLNIQKKDSFKGAINLYAAQKAGIPTTWAEDMRMWLRDKKGLPGPRYASDFNTKQRDIIESIPWDATEAQVNAIWKKHNLDEIPNADQVQQIADEFTSKRTTGGLQIGFGRQ